MQSDRSVTLGTRGTAFSGSMVGWPSDPRIGSLLPNMAPRLGISDIRWPERFTDLSQIPANRKLTHHTKETGPFLLPAAGFRFAECRSAILQLVGWLLIFAMAYAIYVLATPLIEE